MSTQPKSVSSTSFLTSFLTRVEGPPLVVEYFQRVRRRGRLAHAYLFSGPPGSRKRAVARALAKALLCPSGEPCGQCASCHAVDHGNHSNLTIYTSVDQKASLDIADVRNLAQQDRYSRKGLLIWILEEVERLSLPATNALLKTLEEPNPGALLILLTPSTGSLLPTIVSRCHRIPFAGGSGLGSDAAAPDEKQRRLDWLEELAKPSFHAVWEARDWITEHFPDATSSRQPVSQLLDWSIQRFHELWPDWEEHRQPSSGDPARVLEELLSQRAFLDGNINADLVFEALIRLLRQALAS